MIRRAILLVHRSAGTGGGAPLSVRLSERLRAILPGDVEVSSIVAGDHPEARDRARAALDEDAGPTALLVGGGGGTLRAVIEGICAGREPGMLPGPDRVRVAPLRMGSGNILAKQLGAPRDPLAGIESVARSLVEDRTVPCCVVRCDAGPPGGRRARFMVSLGGFGQFGRVPGDLERWHARLPALRRLVASVLGIERLTDLEYGLVIALRAAWCTAFPRACEEVEATLGERTERFRLLTGVLLNFPLPALPFQPLLAPGDPAAALYALRYDGRLAALRLALSPRRAAARASEFRIAEGAALELKLLDRPRAGFFLDEDPEEMEDRLVIRVAGLLAMVPGDGRGHAAAPGRPAISATREREGGAS